MVAMPINNHKVYHSLLTYVWAVIVSLECVSIELVFVI